MGDINKVIDRLVKQYGGKNTVVAKKLSEKAPKRISPQRIGQYRKSGKKGKKPGSDFILLWKEVYGDDLTTLAQQEETLVSRETGKLTSVRESETKYGEDRVDILLRNIDRLGAFNEFLLKQLRDEGKGGFEKNGG